MDRGGCNLCCTGIEGGDSHLGTIFFKVVDLQEGIRGAGLYDSLPKARDVI